MTAWHVTPELMERYAKGTIDVPHAFSVEAHLETCDVCRSQIAGSVDPQRLERMWSQVQGSVSAPAKGVIERLLLAVGVKEYVARLLAATPALRMSWLLALTTVLAIAIGAAYGSAQGYVLFLVIAPLLPVAGVAASYGPGIDPTYEIGIASPMRSFGLLLIRAAAVLVTTTVMAGIGGVLLPEQNWAAAAWLLPSLGLVAATLALSTLIQPLWAAGLVTFSWIAITGARAWIVVGSASSVEAAAQASARSVFGDSMQTGFLVIIVAALVTLVLRQDSFEKGERP